MIENTLAVAMPPASTVPGTEVVLVVEDNPKMAAAIVAGLTEAGLAAEACHTARDARERLAARAYRAVVLDVLLPDADGLEVCRSLRSGGLATPIIMLTALSSIQDKVDGLGAGADDFVAKPFRMDELAARLRAVLRRVRAPEDHTLRCDDLELDLHTRRLSRGGEHCEVTTREYELLLYLLHNQNRVLSREQIGENVWAMDFEPSSNVIDVYISALRKKIHRDGLPPLLHTVRNGGYRLGIMS